MANEFLLIDKRSVVNGEDNVALATYQADTRTIKELITSMSVEEGEYNRSCYYELVPYDEWIEFWNNKKNAIDFK